MLNILLCIDEIFWHCAIMAFVTIRDTNKGRGIPPYPTKQSIMVLLWLVKTVSINHNKKINKGKSLIFMLFYLYKTLSYGYRRCDPGGIAFLSREFGNSMLMKNHMPTGVCHAMRSIAVEVVTRTCNYIQKLRLQCFSMPQHCNCEQLMATYDINFYSADIVV